MARTPYHDSQAESIYQHGAGNDKRMPDALRDLPYGEGKKSGAKPSSGHDQKMTKKGTAGKK